jgi:hypothetical protein
MKGISHAINNYSKIELSWIKHYWIQKLLMFDFTKFNFYFSQNEHYGWNVDHEEFTWKSQC